MRYGITYKRTNIIRKAEEITRQNIQKKSMNTRNILGYCQNNGINKWLSV
jgi:hypothetical protein